MMTENFLLKLLVYQGRDWRPSEDATVSIQANLGTNVAGTSPTDYTSPCPKFNAELCWEVDRKTLRQFKLNRIPIKVKFITGNQDCQKILGYVILPLSLAAEKIEVHAQWHKLLGSKVASSKDSPHILMALSLNDADLEEKDSSSEEEAWQDDADCDEVSENEAEVNHTNGYSSSQQSNGEPVNQNGRGYDKDEECNMDDEEVEDEDNMRQNYLYDSDPEELYNEASDDEKEVEYKNLSEKEEDSCCDVSICSEESNDQSKGTEPVNTQSEHIFDEKSSNVQIISKKDTQMPQIITKPEEENRTSEVCKLVESRSQLRAQLRRQSKEHSLSQLGQSSHSIEETIGTNVSPDISHLTPAVNKRLLDPANLVSSAAKVRKVDTSLNNGEISWNKINEAKKNSSVAYTNDGQYEKINNAVPFNHLTPVGGILKKDGTSMLSTAGSILTKYDKSRFSPAGSILKKDLNQSDRRKSKTTTSSAMEMILSTSGIKLNEQREVLNPESEETCRAELSEDNGYFRIYPTDSGEQKKYTFSVTIVYAKELQQVISDSLWTKLKENGLQFKYSLFGCSVFTEIFFRIDGHILLSERGTATVKSSEAQLRKYFSQNSFLSIDLVSGNMFIANCTVDLDKLQSIDYLQQVVIEGAYGLSVCPAFSKHVEANKATVGLCVELCNESNVNKRDKIYLTKKSNKLNERKYENYHHTTKIHHPQDSFSSSETDSEEELLTRLLSRLKSGKSKIKTKKLMHAMKREKRDYLQEAALEIETWKEEQKQIFMKKWCSREETLQKHLASEWNSKVKIFESILEQRLEGCTQLQDTLSQALSKLSIQESKLKDRETKVNMMEKELRTELAKVRNNHGEAIQKSVVAENKKIELLEKEVKKFKELTRTADKMSKDQMQEIFTLRKKLLQSDDARIMKRENERLSEQLALTEEKKQYYKHQWTSAIAELHSMHSARKHDSVLLLDAEPGPSDRSNLGFKIRHLIEERKALTESGLYPHSHSMVREIDKKIKSLINSTNHI